MEFKQSTGSNILVPLLTKSTIVRVKLINKKEENSNCSLIDQLCDKEEKISTNEAPQKVNQMQEILNHVCKGMHWYR